MSKDQNSKAFTEWVCEIKDDSYCVNHMVHFKPDIAVKVDGRVIRCPAGIWQEHCRVLVVTTAIFKRAMFDLRHYAPVDAWFRRHKIDPNKLKPRGS